jgi:hypothetical protein
MDEPAAPSPSSNTPSVEETLLQWSALSRPYKPLDRQLFMTGVIIAVLVSIIAAFAGEWMLIAVIVAGIFAYYMWSTVPPENTEYILTSKGVRVHGQLYLWQDLSHWWFDNKNGHHMVIIDTPVSVTRRIHLLLGDMGPEKIQQVLNKHLPMDKPEETSMDKAGRWVSEKFPLNSR